MDTGEVSILCSQVQGGLVLSVAKEGVGMTLGGGEGRGGRESGRVGEKGVRGEGGREGEGVGGGGKRTIEKNLPEK